MDRFIGMEIPSRLWTARLEPQIDISFKTRLCGESKGLHGIVGVCIHGVLVYVARWAGFLGEAAWFVYTGSRSNQTKEELIMWKCEECGEGIEDQFDSCWKCAGASLKADNDGSRWGRKCLACGGGRLVKGIVPVAHGLTPITGPELEYSGPEGGDHLWPRKTKSAMAAVVCGECGFTSFYAKEFRAIYEHSQEESSEKEE